MNENCRIRPMVADDFKAAAYIMSCAFGAKMPGMKKYSHEKVADFLLAAGVFDPNNLEDYYVAASSEGVEGIMHLETWTSKKAHKPPTKDLMYLMSTFGVFRVLLSAVSLIFLDNKLKKDEMIVDYIAVHPDRRGKGTGSLLLTFGEDIARQTPGIRRYTIAVIKENMGAMALYERMGFLVYESHSSKILKLFTGVECTYKMEKLFK